jgi:hypothetical protein
LIEVLAYDHLEKSRKTPAKLSATSGVNNASKQCVGETIDVMLRIHEPATRGCSQTAWREERHSSASDSYALIAIRRQCEIAASLGS